jgi:hypothetical protein
MLIKATMIARTIPILFLKLFPPTLFFQKLQLILNYTVNHIIFQVSLQRKSENFQNPIPPEYYRMTTMPISSTQEYLQIRSMIRATNGRPYSVFVRNSVF